MQKLKERFAGDLDFPLLEDKGSQVIKRYGIYNPGSKGWPHPSTYVIGNRGIVRWRAVETDFKKRPSNGQIFQAIRSLP